MINSSRTNWVFCPGQKTTCDQKNHLAHIELAGQIPRFYLVFVWTPLRQEIMVFARVYKDFYHFEVTLSSPIPPPPARPYYHLPGK